MSKVIEEDLVRLKVDVSDRTSAIHEAAKPLLQKGYITEQYVQEMLDAIEEFGPYIVLAPGIAVAHAKPGPSVKRTGISLMTLKEPIKFGHEINDPVSIVIVIASISPNDHIELLKGLVQYLANDDNIEKLKLATSIEELGDLLYLKNGDE